MFFPSAFDRIATTVNYDTELPNIKREIVYELLEDIGFKYDK
jgi:hypothetical protein